MHESLAGGQARGAMTGVHRALAATVLAAALLVCAPHLVSAQAAGGGAVPSAAEADSTRARPRLAVGADVSVTVGPEDPYYFNYTDYSQNALRLFVGSVGLSYAATPWLDAVGEVRVENVDRVWVSALYARVRPWSRRSFTVSAGRVPPVFGAFARTRYGSENPLISRPLPYQYLTTVRYDAVPPSADSLLAVRGRGWRVRYPARPPGSPVSTTAEPGVALVSTSTWDTGVIAFVGSPRVSVLGGVTVGSLSEPRVDDNNSGKQLVARVEWRPSAAWTLGTSLAHGAFLSREAVHAAGAAGNWPQRAIGLDAGFARDHLRMRGEVLVTSWKVPSVASPRIEDPLGSLAATIEAVYRVHPRVDAAMRVDWVGFSDIRGTLYGGVPTPWDAEVSRVEVGGAYKLARRWRLKIAYQYDWRFGASRITRGYPAAQLAVWF